MSRTTPTTAMIGTSVWKRVITAELTEVSAEVAIAESAGGRMKAKTNRPTASRMIFSSMDTPALDFLALYAKIRDLIFKIITTL